jgi:hypothetical protein
MAVTLLPSLNEGLMGLVEKHSAYSKFFILFFNEGSLDNLKIWTQEIYMGVVLCTTLLLTK